MKVLIAGGDRRMLFAKGAFEESGYEVSTIGLDDTRGDINLADIIVLPVPLTRDGVNINCPLAAEKLPLDTFCSLPEHVRVFGGGKLNAKNYTDYLALDEYAVKNAALTAEGAICHAIGHTDFSLYESNILVIGYGRTGKVLTGRLRAFAPRLTVSARSGRDIAILRTLGINCIKTEDIHRAKERFDVVFNTVDIKYPEATAKALSHSLFLDLSSYGGLAPGDAVKYGITYTALPGIPGKTAPITAGKIIAETVINLLNIKGEQYA